jgi:hypothetical protein
MPISDFLDADVFTVSCIVLFANKFVLFDDHLHGDNTIRSLELASPRPMAIGSD